MNLVTYDDKVALNVNSQIADINKVTADDMNAIKNALNNLIFPVGSIIYNSSASFDPNTVYGGTWQRIKGVVIVGVDEDDPDFATSGLTGGEKTHTLTVNEMPNHSHQIRANVENSGGNDTLINKSQAYYSSAVLFNSEPTGGGQPHNNMQPYQTAYIWERTA